MAQSNVIVRLSLKDADAVQRGLVALGADGEKALKRIEAAGRTPSAGLKALGAASDEVRDKLGSLSGQTGALGTALGALGPSGLLAAAGLGAIVAGIGAMMAGARKAIDTLDDLGDAAAKAGVSAEALQELRYAFDQLGVNASTVDGALGAFTVTMGKVGLTGDEAAKKIRIAFEALGISLEDVQKSDPTALLQRVASEIGKIGDTARQAAIAKALGIEDLLPALRAGGDAIADLREKARSLGIVLDEDLVQSAGAAKNELVTMQSVIDSQLTRAMLNAQPLVVGLAQAFATLAEHVGRAVDLLNTVEARATHTLKAEVADLDQQIALQRKNVEAAKAPRNALERGLAGIGLNRPQDLEVKQTQDLLDQLQAERDRRQAEINRREQAQKDQTKPHAALPVIDLGGGGAGGGSAGRAAQDAQREAEAAQRAYAANQKVIADLAQGIVAFGNERRQFVDQALGRLSDSASDEQWGLVEEAANTLYDLKEAQEKATEAARAYQQVMDEGARITESMHTPLERYTLDIEHLNDLLGQGAIDTETWERATTAAKEQLDASTAQTEQLAQTKDKLVDLKGAWDDFGLAASSAFEDAIAGGKGLDEILNGLAADLQKMAIRQFVSKPLMGLLDKGGDAAGSWIANLFTGPPKPGEPGGGLQTSGLTSEGGIDLSFANTWLGGGGQNDSSAGGGAFSGIGGALSGAGSWISGLFASNDNTAPDAMTAALDSSASALSDAGLAGSAAADQLAGSAGTLLDDLGDAGAAGSLVQSGESMVGLIGQGMSAVASMLGSIFGGSGGSSMWSEIIGGVVKGVGMIAGGAGGAAGTGELQMSGVTSSGAIDTRYMLANAQGNAFYGGDVIPFARGGVVHRPTLFPMARGAGLMGEAGPEGVLPLRRTRSGDLGVATSGGGGTNVTVNVINNAGAKVSTKEEKDDNGNVNMTVMIDAMEQAMAARATRPGSTLNRALAQASNPIRAR